MTGGRIAQAGAGLLFVLAGRGRRFPERAKAREDFLKQLRLAGDGRHEAELAVGGGHGDAAAGGAFEVALHDEVGLVDVFEGCLLYTSRCVSETGVCLCDRITRSRSENGR